MISMSELGEPEFIKFLKKMPPEFWMMEVDVHFLEYWYKEYQYCKEHKSSPQFIPPGSEIPGKLKKTTKPPITDREIESFEQWLDGLDKKDKK